MRTLLLIGCVVLSVLSPRLAQAAPKKPKAKPQPELKAPVLAPVPTEPTPPPPAASPPPPPVAAPPPAAAPLPAPVPEVKAADPAPPPSPAAVSLRLQFAGGLSVPVSTRLSSGWVANLGAQLDFRAVPLSPFVRFGIEQHAGSGAVLVAPPAGGFEGAAIENQTLMPLTLGVQWRPLADEKNELGLEAIGRVLAVGVGVSALGAQTVERGVGGELGVEAGYTRRLGPVALFARVAWSMRTTAVGRVTRAYELPWYQVFTVEAGLGL